MGHFTDFGVPTYEAGNKADAILQYVDQHQHGTHSVLVGGIAGGGSYAILAWIRPKMDPSLRLGIAGMVGVVAGDLMYSATGEPNPFGGTWVQDIPRSHYGRGAPPRSATLTISEERGGLKSEDDAVVANG